MENKEARPRVSQPTCRLVVLVQKKIKDFNPDPVLFQRFAVKTITLPPPQSDALCESGDAFTCRNEAGA